MSLLEEALGVWRGPALAEFAAEGFAREEIARLEEERIRAVELKAEAELALGRHAELVGELRAPVAANPLRERLRHQESLRLTRDQPDAAPVALALEGLAFAQLVVEGRRMTVQEAAGYEAVGGTTTG